MLSSAAMNIDVSNVMRLDSMSSMIPSIVSVVGLNKIVDNDARNV